MERHAAALARAVETAKDDVWRQLRGTELDDAARAVLIRQHVRWVAEQELHLARMRAVEREVRDARHPAG